MKQNTTHPRKVFVLTFPGCQVLDVTGPMEALSKARVAIKDDVHTPAYSLTLLAENSGPVKTSGPVSLIADKSYLDLTSEDYDNLDTLIISGGEGINAALKDPRFIAFVTKAAKLARRVVSICTGAFVLAEAGLLNDRCATTHWDAVGELAQSYPQISVDPEAIYVRDGNCWTSAGVTAGIDLTLALIEDDLGREEALSIARRLVVYMMRPGGQAQFSAQLKFQRPAQGRLTSLFEWIEQNPSSDLGIAELASRCAMSERHFARQFVNEVGITPAKFVEHSRLDHARRLLEQSSRPIDSIAHECGFGSSEILRRAFQRNLHLSPTDYRQRFCTTRRHSSP